MLSSDNEKGECKIQTTNLDGETNLKTQCAISQTARLRTDSSFTDLHALLCCEQPNVELYKFVGTLAIHDNNQNDSSADEGLQSSRYSLSAENVLLRGARLKDCPFIYGSLVGW